MLALLALAFVLGAALARRMVPEPWATAGAALVGLSPPALAASTTITPAVPGGRTAGRRRAVRAGGPRAAAAALRVRRRADARAAPVARVDVRGAGRGRRLGAGRLDAARAAPDGGADRRRGARRLARLLRDRQRPLLRRHHAALGRHRGAARPARLHRAGAAARRSVAGPRGRPPALGAAARARVLLRLAALPLAPRPARARGGRRGARPRRARRCCSASSAPRWSWRRSSPAAACAERCSRACRW